MSKKSLVLGYTRTGRPVLLPTHGAPRTNSSELHHRVMTKFPDWTRGDHFDTSRILMEHGERENDPQIGSWCTNWASVHAVVAGRSAGKAPKTSSVRGAAETFIRRGGVRQQPKSSRRR